MKTYHDIPTDGGSNVVGQVTDHAARVAARMASVRHVVAVMSGKGGVGKSSVTVNLGAALARAGRTVGLLDADLNGPSLAQMTGVRGRPLRFDAEGVQPARAYDGLRVMSIDLFLPDDRRPVRWEAPDRNAYTWRGMMEMHAVREFLADTAWGALDVLLIDLPPGAARLPDLLDVLPCLTGALVVTIPSGVSQFVVGKSLHMAAGRAGTRLLGVVENMSAYVCPDCGRARPLFPTGAVERLAEAHGIPYLGGLPFDPRLAACADAGTSFLAAHPDSPAAEAFRRLAETLTRVLTAENPEVEGQIILGTEGA